MKSAMAIYKEEAREDRGRATMASRGKPFTTLLLKLKQFPKHVYLVTA